MSGFIAEFERNIMASGIPCDIYVETLECKSINDGTHLDVADREHDFPV